MPGVHLNVDVLARGGDEALAVLRAQRLAVFDRIALPDADRVEVANPGDHVAVLSIHDFHKPATCLDATDVTGRGRRHSDSPVIRAARRNWIFQDEIFYQQDLILSKAVVTVSGVDRFLEFTVDERVGPIAAAIRGLLVLGLADTTRLHADVAIGARVMRDQVVEIAYGLIGLDRIASARRPQLLDSECAWLVGHVVLLYLHRMKIDSAPALPMVSRSSRRV